MRAWGSPIADGGIDRAGPHPIDGLPMKLHAAAFAATLAVAGAAHELGAQERAPELRIDLPFLDAPYNTAHGLRGPSMSQSLAVSEGFYEVAHSAIERAWGERRVMSAVT